VKHWIRLILFARKYHMLFLAAGLLMLTVSLCACNIPAWISTGEAVIGLAETMIGAILTAMGAVGAAATMVSIVNKILAAMQDALAMYEEYKNNPSTTLLSSIKEGFQAVLDGATQFMTDTGVTNVNLQNKLKSIMQLVINEITALQSTLPALVAKAGEQFTVTVPMDKKQFVAAYNQIIGTPTGDAECDGILAQLKALKA